MCLQQICLSNVIYMPHAQIIQCASIRKAGWYIWNIQTYWHQPHKQCCTQKTVMPTLAMMMLQPDCITYVGHWPVQPKNLACMTVYRHTNTQTKNTDNILQFYRLWSGKAKPVNNPKYVLSRPPQPYKWKWFQISLMSTTCYEDQNWQNVKIIQN